MITSKRYYLWTTLLLEVDEEQYAHGDRLTDDEVCQLVLNAAQGGTLRRMATQQAVVKSEAISAKSVEGLCGAPPPNEGPNRES